jgi:large subunit ribosomal protein L35
MYKLKTRKSAQKRYKEITKNSYSYKHAYKGHLLFHKKKNQKRKLSIINCILKSDLKAVKLMLPY